MTPEEREILDSVPDLSALNSDEWERVARQMHIDLKESK